MIKKPPWGLASSASVETVKEAQAGGSSDLWRGLLWKERSRGGGRARVDVWRLPRMRTALLRLGGGRERGFPEPKRMPSVLRWWFTRRRGSKMTSGSVYLSWAFVIHQAFLLERHGAECWFSQSAQNTGCCYPRGHIIRKQCLFSNLENF